MLDRLVEADRINENESETLWLRVKEEVETTFDDIMGGELYNLTNYTSRK